MLLDVIERLSKSKLNNLILQVKRHLPLDMFIAKSVLALTFFFFKQKLVGIITPKRYVLRHSNAKPIPILQ